MKKLYIIIFLFLTFIFFAEEEQILADEEKSAFTLLNQIRENPSAFSKQIGVNLSKVLPRETLILNEIIVKVARAKALDMAKRDFFAHVDPDGRGINFLINEAGYTLPDDWIQPKSQNFFESIYYDQGYTLGGEGKRAIESLILDKGLNPPGHRQHLLGITDFWDKCFDCGIGIIRSGDKIYCVIIIARNNF